MSFAQSEEQNHAVKAADLLTYDDRELDLFFATHDFSSLSGVLELSPEQRAHLSQRYRALQNLHSDSSGPKLVDPNQLAALLTDVAGNSSSFLFDRPPRSPAESTLTSSPPGTQPREDLCRQELIEDDGHPVCTAEELLDICAQPKISCNAILAWLSDEPDTETGKRELTTLFSNQLERWWDFRKSQWRNRADGNDEGDSGNEALAAYLAANARIYEGRGATGFVSDDSFEETLRRMWQRLSAWRQMPAEKQTFSAYKYAVQKRIRPYQFKRALRLKKDPRQQDSWTTLVEYLNYESWHWEQLTASAESLEPAFFASRILLDGRIMNSTPTVATKGSSLDEKLEAAQDMYRNNISAIRRAVRPYLRARYAAYCQKLRVDWLVELARKTKAEMSQQRGSITAGQTHVTKKRRRDEPQAKNAEPGATAAHSDSGANTTRHTRHSTRTDMSPQGDGITAGQTHVTKKRRRDEPQAKNAEPDATAAHSDSGANTTRHSTRTDMSPQGDGITAGQTHGTKKAKPREPQPKKAEPGATAAHSASGANATRTRQSARLAEPMINASTS